MLESTALLDVDGFLTLPSTSGLEVRLLFTTSDGNPVQLTSSYLCIPLYPRAWKVDAMSFLGLPAPTHLFRGTHLHSWGPLPSPLEEDHRRRNGGGQKMSHEWPNCLKPHDVYRVCS